MKIALVSDYFYPNLGGTHDSAELLARGLAARGHTVEFYVPYYPKREYVRGGVPHRERDLGPGVTIHRLLSIPWFAPLYRMPLPFPTHLLYFAWRRPDLIHIQTIWGLALEATVAAKLFNIPLVVTNHLAMELHAAYLTPRVLKWLARYVRFLCNQADFVSAPTAFALEELGGPIVAPHAAITNPIDLSLFVPLDEDERVAVRRAYGVEGPLIVYAGRLVKEKSIDVLLGAVPEVLNASPQAQLLIAGHGDIRSELEAQARALGIPEHVRFIGTLGKEPLAKLLGAADVFCSMSTSETQGLARLQAMAAGTPAVVARSAATPRPVGGMRLVEPRDTHSCTQVLVELLNSEEMRKREGALARESAQTCAVEKVVDRWEQAYASALAHHAKTIGAAA